MGGRLKLCDGQLVRLPDGNVYVVAETMRGPMTDGLAYYPDAEGDTFEDAPYYSGLPGMDIGDEDDTDIRWFDAEIYAANGKLTGWTTADLKEVDA